MNNDNTIPTGHGALTAPEIVYLLQYLTYKFNREKGMTHDRLISIGVGDDAMKIKYETHLPIIS